MSLRDKVLATSGKDGALIGLGLLRFARPGFDISCGVAGCCHFGIKYLNEIKLIWNRDGWMMYCLSRRRWRRDLVIYNIGLSDDPSHTK